MMNLQQDRWKEIAINQEEDFWQLPSKTRSHKLSNASKDGITSSRPDPCLLQFENVIISQGNRDRRWNTCLKVKRKAVVVDKKSLSFHYEPILSRTKNKLILTKSPTARHLKVSLAPVRLPWSSKAAHRWHTLLLENFAGGRGLGQLIDVETPPNPPSPH